MHFSHQAVTSNDAARPLGQTGPAPRGARGAPKDGGGPPRPSARAAGTIEGDDEAGDGEVQAKPGGRAGESQAGARGQRETSPELTAQTSAGGAGTRGPLTVAPTVVDRRGGPPAAAGPRPAKGPMVPEHRPKKAPGPRG